MPYPAGHKQRTRRAIVRSAAALFTSRGFDGTSIDAVMQACGLTRGAFYAHFRSKAELHAEAMREAGGPDAPYDPRLAQSWTDDILDPLQASTSRASALSGRWAFLAADVCSPTPRVRDAYGVAVRRLAARAARAAPAAPTPGDPKGDDAALAEVALLVGCMAIACSTDDAVLRQAVVRASRRRLGVTVPGPVPSTTAENDLLWQPAAA